MRTHTKLRARWILAAFVAIAILSLIGRERYNAFIDARDRAQLTRDEDALKKEVDLALPVGSERPTVEEFLKDHHIKYVSYAQSWNEGADLLSQVEAYTRPLEARIGRCTIHLTFDFDTQNRLSQYREESVCAE